MQALAVHLARHDVKLENPVDLVAEELDAYGAVVVPRRENLDDVTAHAELPALKRNVIALIADRDKLAQNRVTVDFLTFMERQNHLVITFRRAEAVNARHTRNDDDILALKQRTRRRMAQFIDLVINRRVLLDIRIRRRDIRLRLIKIVVTDKITDVIVREKRLELARQLRRQCFIVRDDESRLLHLLDDFRHRIRLARARCAEQNLRLLTVFDARCEHLDRFRLIAHRFKRRDNVERNGLLRRRRIEFRYHCHRHSPLPYIRISHYTIMTSENI